MVSYAITRKLNHYRRQLALLYKNANETILENIVSTSPIYVNEAVDCDNWHDSGIGHNLTFYLNDEVYEKIGDLDKIKDIGRKIQDDLNTLYPITTDATEP